MAGFDKSSSFRNYGYKEIQLEPTHVTPSSSSVKYIMLADMPVVEVDPQKNDLRILNKNGLPLMIRKDKLYYSDYVEWASRRVLDIGRVNAKKICDTLCLPQQNQLAVAEACKGLSLIDSYWIKDKDSDDTWGTVNLFENSFNEAIAELAFTGVSAISIQGPYKTPELTGGGSYAKCWVRESDGIYLYKANTEHGKESEAEYITSLILGVLDIPHVRYKLCKHKGIVSSKCKLLTSLDYSIAPIFEFINYFNRQKKNGLEIIKSGSLIKSSAKDYLDMSLIDGIVNNIDRHTYNWGILINAKTYGIIGLHPLFDHNCALNLKNAEGMCRYAPTKTLLETARDARIQLGSNQNMSALVEWLNNKDTIKLFKKVYGNLDVYKFIKERVNYIMK